MLTSLTQSNVCVSREFTPHIAQVSPTYAPFFIMFQSRVAYGSSPLNASKRKRVHLRSLTTLKEKLINILARTSSATGAMSESKWPRSPSRGIYTPNSCDRSPNCGGRRSRQRREAFDLSRVPSKQWETCVLMTGEFVISTRRSFSACPSCFLESFGGGLRLPGTRKRSKFGRNPRPSGECPVRA